MANTSAVYARIDTNLKENAESILSLPAWHFVDKTVTDFLCTIPEMKIKLKGEYDD